MNGDELELQAQSQHTIDGFDRGDADAPLEMAHPRAVARMAGLGAVVRAAQAEDLAPQVLCLTERFDSTVVCSHHS